MIDLQADDRWIELGKSCAWGWQQGCMLQWMPGSATEVLWNDRQGDRFVCHLLDTKTRERRTIHTPVYCLSPDGKRVCIDSPHTGQGRQLHLIDIAGIVT